ncbi:hypothetical protein M501DRAFT_940345 [Patellaria atrata CBS 101060]|uniref:STEEP1 domain-containing protein n=1 Tax=Patellaria atrata CBS 101060 TaxID=1346257 RepID=A0A9P4VNR4_9PEZI|nr:hypothetical protein M501DRAFT_940345 [Patellaria atrata CBS 101060]
MDETVNLNDNLVHTYHCLCTQLLLASTTTLSNLPHRLSSRDYILPLPTLPNNLRAGLDPEEVSRQTSSNDSRGRHCAILLNTVSDKSPIIITPDEGGFEKRYLQRCGRCKLTIGYHLDRGQYSIPGKDDLNHSPGSSGKEDVIYLLQGGFLDTKMMVTGESGNIQRNHE